MPSRAAIKSPTRPVATRTPASWGSRGSTFLQMVETVGIEPTSAGASETASTSVAGALDLALHSPTPAGLWSASPLELSPRSARAGLPGVSLLSDSA